MKLKPVQVHEWHSSLDTIVDDMQGKPLNVHCLLAHNPSLLKAWWPYRNYIVNGGSLGRRRTELVILRTACNLSSWYEWASHVERAMVHGVSFEEIDCVKAGKDSGCWAPGDYILIKAVDDLSLSRQLSKETLEELYKHYSVAQMLDIVATQGMYSTLGYMISTWPIELDAHVAEALPDAVKQELFC